MSRDFIADINAMHDKFKVKDTVNGMNADMLSKFWKFRLDCIQEEVDETVNAETADDAVDGLIDMIVFALGTLNAFGVDEHLAWTRVHLANIVKEPGIKEGRPNEFGFPDLIKPEGWKAPSHVDNVGLLSKVFE